MTVIDEVLAAEKASEAKLTEAKEAATSVVVGAKKTQAEALVSEKTRLAEIEKNELASHQAHVEKSAEKIVHDAQAKVQTVETKFAQKSAAIVEKIKVTLA